MTTKTPVTVFTGFLGAGKSTIILSLLRQHSISNPNSKIVLLKNEFGDVEVDSMLAKQQSIAAVSEILNGCMCCVLVGQMRTALLEIKEKFAPDRIIIESSGSAFPATLAWQVRQLEPEGLALDAVITVIDCLNFKGYEDKSPTAKMQAKYTDLLLLNKWELVDERQLDNVLDELHELNDLTPKLRCAGKEGVSPSLIFGIDSKITTQLVLESSDRSEADANHAEPETGEVESHSIWRGGQQPGHSHTHQTNGVIKEELKSYEPQQMETWLSKLPTEDIYRVKGFVRLSAAPPASEEFAVYPTTQSQPNGKSSDVKKGPGIFILNWAFGRTEWTRLDVNIDQFENVSVRLTIMGGRGEVLRSATLLATRLEAQCS